MDSNAVPLLMIFERKLHLEVPLFQRQYVWSREQQWEPLWEDISRKFVEYLEGRTDAPVHFLGAMVLDQKQTPVTHVEKRQIIDGQQRLITLQVVLTALRDFCWAEGVQELGDEVGALTLNSGMMPDRDVNQFKVWPTQLDRPQFRAVILSKSREEIENKYPQVRRKYARKPEPRPRMIEAYLFFYGQLTDFFKGDGTEPPLNADIPFADRVETCFQALKNGLRVVAIDLGKDDDAQIIFETLNARGEPLLPADLLRNFIFLRAGRLGEPAEALYEEYWRKFDDPFWRKEIRQGRLLRPRSDLFLQHFLASRQSTDIPIKHLFVEYKYWIQKAQPFGTVREELQTLARQGDDFRRLLEPPKDDPLSRIATFLQVFDMSTVYPFMLAFLNRGPTQSDIEQTSRVLESYLLRRAVCGLTPKNYNRIFLQMARALQDQPATSVSVQNYLAALTGESSKWPGNEEFAAAWLEKHAYQILNSPKIVYILLNLNETYRDEKSERISIDTPLTVEHIMPQDWTEFWPLQDGTRGMSPNELWDAAPGDPRAEATRRRNAVLQTLGNLTIITDRLNPSLSNAAWAAKKPELLRKSLLPINQMLHEFEIWDESTIGLRGMDLLARALAIWPKQGTTP